MASLIVSAIEQALKSNPENSALCQVFSYQDDFQKLWELVDRAESESQMNTLIIVWDGIPAHEIPLVYTEKYLTPFDWAVAVSLSQSTGDAVETFPFNIIILDLCSGYYKNSDGVLF